MCSFGERFDPPIHVLFLYAAVQATNLFASSQARRLSTSSEKLAKENGNHIGVRHSLQRFFGKLRHIHGHIVTETLRTSVKLLQGVNGQ